MTILDKIIINKKQEVANAKSLKTIAELQDSPFF